MIGNPGLSKSLLGLKGTTTTLLGLCPVSASPGPPSSRRPTGGNKVKILYISAVCY